MQTPEPDDPEVQGSAQGAGGAGSFWQRYSGRAGQADPDGEAESAADRNGEHGDHHCLEWCPICRGAELLRDAVPPELQEQFQLVQRDALLMAQALIESHLNRMREPSPRPPSQGEPTGGFDPGGTATRADEGPDLESIPIE